jgi:deazaflavin-dependent oxidoreductase (nitroreductase family)
MGKLNVPVYKLTRGRLMNSIGDAPVLLLTTTGRRSGQRRTAPVCFVADGDVLAVIGSNVGNPKAPAWALNLDANPDAEIQIRGDRRSVRARLAEGDERSHLWAKMTDQYKGFDDYESRTSRTIKVFALEPR